MSNLTLTKVFLNELSKPFPIDKIKFRPGATTSDKSKAIALPYIDARDVIERLNEVAGTNWQSDYKEVAGNTYAGIGILIERKWVWRWDVGVESNTGEVKGQASDSFKRAGVKWGIGSFLYDLPTDWVNTETYEWKGQLKVKGFDEISINNYKDKIKKILFPETVIPFIHTQRGKDLSKKYFAMAKAIGKNGVQAKDGAKKAFNLDSFKDVTEDQLNQLIKVVDKKIKAFEKEEEKKEDLKELSNGDMDKIEKILEDINSKEVEF